MKLNGLYKVVSTYFPFRSIMVFMGLQQTPLQYFACLCPLKPTTSLWPLSSQSYIRSQHWFTINCNGLVLKYFCMLQCNLNGFKAHLPQAHGSFKAVLLVAVSPSRSTGLQLGTDAGMSSVLLTMIRVSQDFFGFVVSNSCPLLIAVVRVCCMAFSVRRNDCLDTCKDTTKTT